MKLAYSSNAYMKVSIEEAVRRVGAIGFEAVELMADVPHFGILEIQLRCSAYYNRTEQLTEPMGKILI